MQSLDSLGVVLRLNQSSLQNDYLSLYENKISARFSSSFRLLLITNQKENEIAKMYLTRFGDAEITVLSYGRSQNSKLRDSNITFYQYISFEQMLSNSIKTGYFDVIIEHCSNKKSHKIKIFKEYYPFLNVNGLFFIEELHAKFIPQLVDCEGDDILDMLCKVSNIKLANKFNPEHRRTVDQFLIALADSCDSILIREKLAAIDKKVITLRGLRSNEALQLLSEGAISGKNIYRNDDAYLYEHKNKSIINLEKNASRHPKKFIIRESYINKFQDAICELGQIVHNNGFLLPDSFRMQHQKILVNRHIRRLTENLFLGNEKIVSKRLEGEYLYLDSELPGHFGHFTSEVVSRLWAWDKLKSHNPELKVLIGIEKGKDLPKFAATILEYFGICKDDIVTFDDCVSVENLYTASPYYVIGDHINPAISAVWNKIAEQAKGGISEINGDKLFIARPAKGGRKCLNPERLEDMFKESGFEFYNPENHTWLDQIKTFSQAKVIAGYAGSGTFNTMFSNSVKKMFIIGSDSYTSCNEHYICAIKNIDLTYFWGDSLLQHGSQWSAKAFMSDYNFNYERDEAALRESLRFL